jgi:hypothetical protein
MIELRMRRGHHVELVERVAIAVVSVLEPVGIVIFAIEPALVGGRGLRTSREP